MLSCLWVSPKEKSGFEASNWPQLQLTRCDIGWSMTSRATYKAMGMKAAPPRPKRLNSTGCSMTHQLSVLNARWMANIQPVACTDAIHSSKPGRSRVGQEGESMVNL